MYMAILGLIGFFSGYIRLYGLGLGGTLRAGLKPHVFSNFGFGVQGASAILDGAHFLRL